MLVAEEAPAAAGKTLPVSSNGSTRRSSSGREREPAAGESACGDKAAEDTAVPAASVQAGSAARPAQLPETGGLGLRAANRSGKFRSKAQPAKAGEQHMTWEAVQKLLDGGLDRAAAAVDAAQEEARQARALSPWMLRYQHYTQIFCSRGSAAIGEAERLCSITEKWFFCKRR